MIVSLTKFPNFILNTNIAPAWLGHLIV